MRILWIGEGTQLGKWNSGEKKGHDAVHTVMFPGEHVGTNAKPEVSPLYNLKPKSRSQLPPVIQDRSP